jgi:hypothetical protein
LSSGQVLWSLGFEDAVNGILVQMRQEMADHKGEVIERKAGGRAQTMVPSSSVENACIELSPCG